MVLAVAHYTSYTIPVSIFSLDTATKPGDETPDPVQYSAHLQSIHEPKELCVQHWGRR